MLWWLDNLPRQEGFHDGKLLDWYGYIVGYRYDEIYPQIVDSSSECQSGWADRVLDGTYGT